MFRILHFMIPTESTSIYLFFPDFFFFFFLTQVKTQMLHLPTAIAENTPHASSHVTRDDDVNVPPSVKNGACCHGNKCS